MLLKADLHVHTEHSPDSRTSLPDAITAAKRAGMDFLAVTDHDVPPVDEVFSQPEREGVLLIPGVEYSTDKGHLLGLFLTVPCPAHTGRRLPFSEAAALIHGCGGVAVLAHPFQSTAQTAEERFEMLREMEHELDGVEICNRRATKKDCRPTSWLKQLPAVFKSPASPPPGATPICLRKSARRFSR